MAPKTVASWMLTRPSSSSRGAAAVLEDGDQLLVRGAVRLHPRGAERRAFDDLPHDQVDELVGAGRERPPRGGGELQRLALELLDGGGLHGVVVGERGDGLDVGVGVTHHPVHPHREQAEGEQDGGEETCQRGCWGAEHRRDTSDRRKAPVRGCGRGLLRAAHFLHEHPGPAASRAPPAGASGSLRRRGGARRPGHGLGPADRPGGGKGRRPSRPLGRHPCDRRTHHPGGVPGPVPSLTTYCAPSARAATTAPAAARTMSLSTYWPSMVGRPPGNRSP